MHDPRHRLWGFCYLTDSSVLAMDLLPRTLIAKVLAAREVWEPYRVANK